MRHPNVFPHFALSSLSLSLAVFAPLAIAAEPAVVGANSAVRAAPVLTDFDQDNFGATFEVGGDDSKVVRVTLPPGAFGNASIRAAKPVDANEPPRSRPKILPSLAAMVKSRGASDLADVIVMFKEDTKIPHMPSLNPVLRRDAEENVARLGEIKAKIEAVKTERLPKRAGQIRMISSEHGGRVKDSFWLVNGVVAELPLAAMEALALRNDVISIEPSQSDIPPPSHGTARHVSDGRLLIDSDRYYNDYGGYLGLLDSGVRSTHSLLTSPDRVDFERDCTGGDANGICDSLPNTQDTVNHGVSSAAIITGNNNMTDTFRGVSRVVVDSLKIYGPDVFLNRHAAVTAFQYAVSIGDSVIVAEIQDVTGDSGSVSLAADAAFDSGSVIIAVAGNYGPGAGTVSAPGNAHKALAIGAYDVVSGILEDYSGRGPTSDGRTKPDLIFPTNTLTASSESDTATREFGGTSGAAPYAGAIAVGFYNFLRTTFAPLGFGGTAGNGFTYSYMLASAGDEVGRLYYNDMNKGAGKFKTRAEAGVYIQRAAIANKQSIDMSFTMNAGRKAVDVALWWPETSAQAHNDIDIVLISPAGAEVGWGSGSTNVFEKIRYARTSGLDLAQGVWKVRVYGYHVPVGPQEVYMTSIQK